MKTSLMTKLRGGRDSLSRRRRILVAIEESHISRPAEPIEHFSWESRRFRLQHIDAIADSRARTEFRHMQPETRPSCFRYATTLCRSLAILSGNACLVLCGKPCCTCAALWRTPTVEGEQIDEEVSSRSLIPNRKGCHRRDSRIATAGNGQLCIGSAEGAGTLCAPFDPLDTWARSAAYLSVGARTWS